MFAFGFVLAGQPGLWAAVGRVRLGAAMMAAFAGAVVVAIELAYPADTIPPHGLMALNRAAMVTMAWSVTLLLFDFAERRLNRDHRSRRPLAEAVFPAYLVHEPVIAIAAWATLPLGLGAPVEGLLLLSVTMAACAAAYFVGRRIGWLRPLIGLAPRR